MPQMKKMKKNTGNGPTISTKDLASLVDLSQMRLSQLVQAGVLARSGHGTFDLVKTLLALVGYYRRLGSKKFGRLEELRCQRLEEQIGLLSMDRKLKAGELIYASFAERLWTDALAAIRAIVMGSKLSDEDKEDVFYKLRDIPPAMYRQQASQQPNTQPETDYETDPKES